MSSARTLHLFEGHGIEIEYMIVDRETLAVRPIADELLHAAAGDWVGDFDAGAIGWSNELVAHLIELKTSGPVPALAGVSVRFDESVARVDELLAGLGARLMPSGMHPLMDPRRETQLWPREYAEVYRAFDRLFDCKRHGWANLQSTHLNLSFDGDAEFARLHAAARLVLPILPALAAASPIVEGKATGRLDSRLFAYRENCARIPSMSGVVVPEPIFDAAGYRARILERIWADAAPLDPDGILREEWANARGAIARFDRSAIEIRLLDAQECPRADLAVSAAVTAAVRALATDRWAEFEEQATFSAERLAAILWEVATRGPATRITDGEYLRALGWNKRVPARAGDVWAHLVTSLASEPPGDVAHYRPSLDFILGQGTLAERILRALGGDLRRERIVEVYRELCDCLRTGRLFGEGALSAAHV